MRKLTLVVALAGLVACEDGTLTEAEAPRLPELAEAIVDGRDEGGNTFFHWQPPIATDAYRPSGEFASELYHLLSVEICEWGGDGCVGEPVARFSSSGRGAEKLSMFKRWGVFSAVWNTRRARVDRSKLYRMIVRADGVELGFADIDIVRRLWQAWRVDRDEFVPVSEKLALPIVFTVERGALLRTLDVSTECANSAFKPTSECGEPGFANPLTGDARIVSMPSGLLIDGAEESARAEFSHGSEVTLRVEGGSSGPSGYPFAVLWGGDCENTLWPSRECVVDLSSDGDVDIRFEYLPESELRCRPSAVCWEGAITVDVPSALPYPNGRVQFGQPFTGWWPIGTELTMTAHPPSSGGYPGWEFDGWRTPCLSNPDERSCRISTEYAQYEVLFRARSPSIPELVGPANGAAAASAVLSWTAVEPWEHISYSVQVALDEAFSDIVIDSTVQGTEFLVPLPPGTYWWRVGAGNGFVNLTLCDCYGESQYSPARELTLLAPPA